MKAVVLHEFGDANKLRFENFEDPQLNAGEVLVRVHGTSINPADWMLRSGSLQKLFPIDLPFIPGIDLAGIVETVGDGVTAFRRGDAVMAAASRTYAEICAAKAKELVKIPEGLDMTRAAALPLVNLTGDQLVHLGANVKEGQTILITGALGSVGRSAVFAAKEAGARIIAGVRAKSVERARALPGVSEAVAVDDDAALDRLPRLDCVADTIGGQVALKLVRKVREGGNYGCFPASPVKAEDYPQLHINSVFAKPVPATTLHYAQAVRDGRLTIPVAHIFPLSEAASAQAMAEKGGVGGKIVLMP